MNRFDEEFFAVIHAAPPPDGFCIPNPSDATAQDLGFKDGADWRRNAAGFVGDYRPIEKRIQERADLGRMS